MMFRFDARAGLAQIRNHGALPATVATPATVSSFPRVSVASVAGVAGGRPEIESLPADLCDLWEERAALIHEGNCQTFADDGSWLAEPVFHLTRAEAERRALADVAGGAA